jgi:DNA-binding transcriptional MerR regulator
MRIKAASRALDVPVPTLRRWTQEFASGLSPEARASEGRPREFTPRDMRVLRRAKDILRTADMTYDRARRALAEEALLAEEPEAAPPGRDEAGDREAAERFVREVVASEVGALRESQAQLAGRVAELERQLRSLEAELEARPAQGAPGTGPAAESEEARGDRRRGWFR